MTATELAAWAGATSGVGSLLWNVYTKLTSGPRLTVTAFANMVQMPPPPGNPRFLKITVQNIGTATTTLTNLGFDLYPSRWAKLYYKPKVIKFVHRTRLSKLLRRPDITAAVLNEFQGPRLPYKLEVGGEWQALMQQDETFNEWLKSDEFYCAVSHSFSKHPRQVRIIPGPTKPTS